MRTRTIQLLQFVLFPLSCFIKQGNINIQFLFLALCFLAVANGHAQNWKATGALTATGSPMYLIGATSVGDNVFVLSADQTIAYSTDKGSSWVLPAVTKPNGNLVGIVGTKDRLYASIQLSTFDFELYYSMDKGSTWTIDTVGLPINITRTGKSAMILKYMGNDYVLAHNYTKAVYKKPGETNWKSTSIDNVIVDIAATSDKWLAIGQTKILQSTDYGTNWTTINTIGLPANFQGSLISTNGSRIFVSNNPASGGTDIYFSDDGGINWTLTNSSGKFNYSNPWLKSIYAVEDYVFASVSPKFADFQNPPPFILSSTRQPDFTIGDISGLPTGKTNTNLPFFFHVGKKLFTMFWDLYSSEPGFSGITTSTNELQNQEFSFSVYPNPGTKTIQLTNYQFEIAGIVIYNLHGKVVFKQNTPVETSIDVSGLNPGWYFIQAISKTGISYQTKFVKN